jgi:XTP/dITP diphosphohydrolase
MYRLPDKVVMASGNLGKLREIENILSDLDIQVLPQSALGVIEADETGTTFVANALLKAGHAANTTGMAAIADDSGLVVAALDGRPGIYSARYSGPDASDADNIDKLLRELDGVEDHLRDAEFQCAVCLVTPDGAAPLIATGKWRGRILCERRGEGGFGYDPVFFDVDCGRSAAELSSDEKNERSHRGKALRRLAAALRRA